MSNYQAHSETTAEHSVHHFYIPKRIYIYYGILLPNIPTRIGAQAPSTPILQIRVWSWFHELGTASERKGELLNS